ILILSLYANAPSAFCSKEELLFVSDGPVAVGGGLFHHSENTENDSITTRYSFEGIHYDSLLIEKHIRSARDRSPKVEVVKLPIKETMGKKKALLYAGSHLILLTINKYDRVVVKKLK
ncbi:MAG: hypothetical protein ABH883_00190, partial [Candidatus Omnitrophota bacterium]